MVGPITGAPTIQDSGPGFYFQKIGQRQKRPYNLPTTFANRVGLAMGPSNFARAAQYVAYADSVNGSNSSYARAYDNLVKTLGENASLGVTLVQWKQADSMIRKRANQLSSFAVQLARRSPIGVASSLGISLRQAQAVMSVRYGTARKLSDLWLEFWFGWKPMVTDIYAAAQVFDQELPFGKLKGSSRTKFPYAQVQAPATKSGEAIYWQFDSRCTIGVDVRITNPNARLLQQFGLLNPAVVAFDAIPWSFVLGWFSNVNSWLSSFTDFAGLETRNVYVVRRTDLFGRTFIEEFPVPSPNGNGYGAASVYTRDVLSSIPRPALQWKDFKLPLTRALTAISLLTQKLPRR